MYPSLFKDEKNEAEPEQPKEPEEELGENEVNGGGLLLLFKSQQENDRQEKLAAIKAHIAACEAKKVANGG